MRLPQACTIRTGYTARGRLEPATDGGVPVIQLRDVPSDGTLDANRLTRMRLAEADDRYFVRSGDVLFRSRGERNTAIALNERFEEAALAVLPLMILRPNRKLITPEYLAWCINQRPAQRHFDNVARGTNIRMIPRSALDELEIDVPDLEMQERIVAVDALAQRERDLLLLAAQAKRDLMSLILAERARTARVDARQERTPE